jgi:transposase
MLLRALLPQACYSICSECRLMEKLDLNLLYRWFGTTRPPSTVGLGMDDAVWDTTILWKNRDRLLNGDLARRFLEEVVTQARLRGLFSCDHFLVEGTLIEA